MHGQNGGCEPFWANDHFCQPQYGCHHITYQNLCSITGWQLCFLWGNTGGGGKIPELNSIPGSALRSVANCREAVDNQSRSVLFTARIGSRQWRSYEN